MRIFVSAFYILITVCISFFSIDTAGATEASIIQSIIKIKSYEARPDSSFVFRSYGSAIAISPDRILTNAHVILGSDDEPTGYYEVCFSYNFEKVPVCNERAQLIAYDTVADLAILQLSRTRDLQPFVLSPSKIAIGSYVSMYGYPGIGGETITRTDGKIAGYEQLMYKIDGSIDHGNSGGGAFNNSGELIGMPTAVASDNASIGYMIPVHRIQEFLSKKSPNYEIYKKKPELFFVDFLARIQSYTPGKLVYRWNDVIVRNPRSYGFLLNSTMISPDNRMVNWKFADSYNRVSFSLSCTDDVGIIAGWQARISGLKKEREAYPGWTISPIDEKEYLSIYSMSKDYDPSVVIYYKAYDSCFAEVDYKDPKKDAKSLEKAIKFLKKEISFRQPYAIPTSQINPYFSISNIEKNTRIIRSVDEYGVISILLGVELSTGEWINAVIEQKEYPTRDELGTTLDMDFSKITTWEQYIAGIVEFGIERSEITTLDLASNKKGVFVTHYNSEKKIMNATFQYIYETNSGGYAYWSWSANIPGDKSMDLTRLKKLFTSLSYPGSSFIDN